MGKYIVKKPIIEADARYERGSEVELTDERASAIGSDYVAPVAASEVSPASPEGSEEAPTAPEASNEEADGSEEESEDEESSEEEGSNEE